MNEGLNLFSDEQLFDEINKRRLKKENKLKKISQKKLAELLYQKNKLLFEIEDIDNEIKNSISIENCEDCLGKGWNYLGNEYGDPYFRKGDNGSETCFKCDGKGFIDKAKF